MKIPRSRTQQAYIVFLLLMFTASAILLVASATLGNSPDLIVSDGNGYYAWIRSLLIDGDLDFTNDFEQLYYPEPSPFASQVTPKGLVPNKYPIGVAILEIPGFLLGHFIAHITPFAADGISLPYQLSVTLSLVSLIIFSFYLFFLGFKNYRVDSYIAALFCGMELLATNLIHYLAKEPAMAHGASLALVNILVFLTSFKVQEERKNSFSSLGYGLLIGLLVLVRNTNIVLFPFLIFLFRKRLKQNSDRVQFCLGVVIMLFLQQLSLFLLWGNFVIYSYGEENFQKSWLGVFNVTFGTSYGLFLYHPWYFVLLLLNLVGFVWLKSERNLIFSILLGFISLVIINGLWDRAGDSFGHRMFIETLTPLSFGAAIAVSQVRQLPQKIKLSWVLPAAAVAIASNFYLWAGYLLQQYPHNSDRTIFTVYQWLLS